MQIIDTNGGALVKAWIDGVQLEDQARKQIETMATLPFIHKHIAIMPDVHFGNGATVGSVIPTKGAVVPASVGVDIGCGMIAMKTSLKASDLPDSLGALRTAIEKAVPHGRTDDGGVNDRGAWGKVPSDVQEIAATKYEGLKRILEKHQKIERAASRLGNHLGTLGGGNHFIEVCLDLDQNVWIMLHSGSRGIGNRIGSYFIEKAKEDMRRWYINLPDQELAYIPQGSEHFSDYMVALNWAQDYAKMNRDVMMKAVVKAMKETLGREFEAETEAVNCHHNYVSQERHFGENVFVTRKGAVKITPTELGIIPGSMGAKSFIVRGIAGKALAESFNSCSHGAGRAMSRNAAKKLFSLADHAQATQGVECRKDADVLDETPGAYKNIDDVMTAQSDHVEVVAQLKQILCVKG